MAYQLATVGGAPNHIKTIPITIWSGRVFLSCNQDGTVVDLWSQDDGSGRQRWQVQ
jgi:hypothetical protein